MITADDERVRPPAGEGFADSVTVAFGDPGADVYAIARLGIVPGAEPRASALAVLCAGGRPVGAVARARSRCRRRTGPALEAAGVRMETLEPLAGWRVAFTAEGAGFDVRLSRADGAPIELEEAGGMAGLRPALPRAGGTAVVGGNERPLDALGQRAHAWGVADWDRIGVGADGRGVDRRGPRRGPAGRAAARARAATTPTRSTPGCWGEDGPQQLSEGAPGAPPTTTPGASAAPASSCGKRDDSEYPHRVGR